MNMVSKSLCSAQVREVAIHFHSESESANPQYDRSMMYATYICSMIIVHVLDSATYDHLMGCFMYLPESIA